MNIQSVYCVYTRNLGANLWLLLDAKSMPFGCMSMARLGAKYAVVGCKSMETFGCMYAVVGCMYAETFGCMYAAFGSISDTAESLPDSRELA